MLITNTHTHIHVFQIGMIVISKHGVVLIMTCLKQKRNQNNSFFFSVICIEVAYTGEKRMAKSFNFMLIVLNLFSSLMTLNSFYIVILNNFYVYDSFFVGIYFHPSAFK